MGFGGNLVQRLKKLSGSRPSGSSASSDHSGRSESLSSSSVWSDRSKSSVKSVKSAMGRVAESVRSGGRSIMRKGKETQKRAALDTSLGGDISQYKPRLMFTEADAYNVHHSTVDMKRRVTALYTSMQTDIVGKRVVLEKLVERVATEKDRQLLRGKIDQLERWKAQYGQILAMIESRKVLTSKTVQMLENKVFGALSITAFAEQRGLAFELSSVTTKHDLYLHGLVPKGAVLVVVGQRGDIDCPPGYDGYGGHALALARVVGPDQYKLYHHHRDGDGSVALFEPGTPDYDALTALIKAVCSSRGAQSPKAAKRSQKRDEQHLTVELFRIFTNDRNAPPVTTLLGVISAGGLSERFTVKSNGKSYTCRTAASLPAVRGIGSFIHDDREQAREELNKALFTWREERQKILSPGVAVFAKNAGDWNDEWVTKLFVHERLLEVGLEIFIVKKVGDTFEFVCSGHHQSRPGVRQACMLLQLGNGMYKPIQLVFTAVADSQTTGEAIEAARAAPVRHDKGSLGFAVLKQMHHGFCKTHPAPGRSDGRSDGRSGGRCRKVERKYVCPGPVTFHACTRDRCTLRDSRSSLYVALGAALDNTPRPKAVLSSIVKYVKGLSPSEFAAYGDLHRRSGNGPNPVFPPNKAKWAEHLLSLEYKNDNTVVKLATDVFEVSILTIDAQQDKLVTHTNPKARHTLLLEQDGLTYTLLEAEIKGRRLPILPSDIVAKLELVWYPTPPPSTAPPAPLAPLASPSVDEWFEAVEHHDADAQPVSRSDGFTTSTPERMPTRSGITNTTNQKAVGRRTSSPGRFDTSPGRIYRMRRASNTRPPPAPVPRRSVRAATPMSQRTRPDTPYPV